MQIKKTCPICNKEFYVPHWRLNAKYCSPVCRQIGLHAPNNVVCTNCGKPFHMKKHQLERYSRNMGVFCSRGCENEYRKIWFMGENNHQYGLRGDKNASYSGEVEQKMKNNQLEDIMVLCVGHPYAEHGRVKKHRLIVEQNHDKFPSECFEEVDGFIVLKRGLQVHHKDGNHDNNDLSNLQIVTRGEHCSIHNKMQPMPRNKKTGQFTKRV